MTGTTLERRMLTLLLAAAALLLAAAALAPAQAGAKTNSYQNPILPRIPGNGVVESCADPSVIRSQTPGDPHWYAYCTTDPLNDEDRNASGGFNFHLIPILRSLDLVNWTYMGDAFRTRPAWVAPDAGLWAPEIKFFNGRYYLYYGAQNTRAGGSAIGVGTSTSPTGPFVDSGAPVVEPHAPQCCPNEKRWTFDPFVIESGGIKYIFYGSYFGGISARQLSPDGLRSNPATQVQITIDNRYEAPYVVQKDGWWYLFVSATDCCRGPLTGYSVFVGRSRNLLGPYVDHEGQSLLQGRVGGKVFLSMNGNRFVGPGHNAVFSDFDGQWWTLYHAVDRFDPYFEGAVGFTKRPLMLDPVDWINGWPTVRGDLWISDSGQHGPAAQPGDKTNYRTPNFRDVRLGHLQPEYSDEFNSPTLSPRWTWVRPAAPGAEWSMTGQTFRFNTQPRDLHESSNNASVLTEPAPKQDYVVETKVHMNLPPEGCCFNYTQAGLVVYRNDDNYVKLVHVSIWNTRQTEFAKEWFPVPAGWPRYGNTVVTSPNDWTWFRIVRCGTGQGEERYTPYVSRDGVNWNRGGTWTHNLRDDTRFGLVSMGGAGFVANFDYVRVYKAHECAPNPR